MIIIIHLHTANQGWQWLAPVHHAFTRKITRFQTKKGPTTKQSKPIEKIMTPCVLVSRTSHSISFHFGFWLRVAPNAFVQVGGHIVWNEHFSIMYIAMKTMPIWTKMAKTVELDESSDGAYNGCWKRIQSKKVMYNARHGFPISIRMPRLLPLLLLLLYCRQSCCQWRCWYYCCCCCLCRGRQQRQRFACRSRPSPWRRQRQRWRWYGIEMAHNILSSSSCCCCCCCCSSCKQNGCK